MRDSEGSHHEPTTRRSPSTATAARLQRHRRLRRLRGQLPARARARRRRGHRRRRGAGHAHARAGRAGADAALQHARPAEPTPPSAPVERGRAAVKRHLLVTNDFPPKVGGIQNYLWELWSRLDPASFVVLTASSRSRTPPPSTPRRPSGVSASSGCPSRSSSSRRPSALASVRRCVDGARRSTSSCSTRPSRSGCSGRRLGVPYGVILHGAEVTVPGPAARRPRRAGPCAARRLGRRLGRAATRPPRAAAPSRHLAGAGRRDPARRRHRRHHPARGGRAPGRPGRLGLPGDGPAGRRA